MNKKIEEIIILRLQEDDYTGSISFEEREEIKAKLIRSLPIKKLKLPKPEIIKTEFGDWNVIAEKSEKINGSESGYVETRIKIVDLKNNLIVANMALVHICDKNWNALKMSSKNPVENLYGLFFNSGNEMKSLKLYYKIKYLNLSETEIQKLAKENFLSGMNYKNPEYEYIQSNIIPLEIIYSKLEKDIARRANFKNINSIKEHSVGKPWIDMVYVHLRDIIVNEHYNTFSFLNKKNEDDNLNKQDLERIMTKYKMLSANNIDVVTEKILKILINKSLEYTKINNYDLYLGNSIYSYEKMLKNIFENHKECQKEKKYNKEYNKPRLFIKSKKEGIIQKQKKINKNRIKN